MKNDLTRWLAWLAAAGFALQAASALAVPLTPKTDDEVVETLPTLGAFAAEQRTLRRQLAAQPRDAATALALSKSTLARARNDGDARLAGQALGVLRAWDGDDQAPIEIRLQRATLLQHLHQFDAATKELEGVLREQPRHAQALLTLATIHRVQGRYEESDAACARLSAAGQPLYGGACTAENRALRGEFDAARRRLESLVNQVPGNPGWAAWIRTTLGELELRAGRRDAAVAQLQAALRLERDPYTRLALVDALIEGRRFTEAQALLAEAGDGDAALLRRAIVAQALGTADAAAQKRALAERYAQAALRPEAAAVHARERARFALEVEREPQRALELARSNLKTQREAIDLVLMDRAARAAGDAAAQAEVAALAQRIGLRDARLGPAAGNAS
ncbi:tetratricopeptide repeat protein [Methylibium sp.]|uniref:tetratricopeptide repeat protein n=1 Tax=Methylibium sp. TaxID=2067992 RepID=UPI00286C5582|nr:tetratricopeptide repeat protein [Methylibium sp.]